MTAHLRCGCGVPLHRKAPERFEVWIVRGIRLDGWTCGCRPCVVVYVSPPRVTVAPITSADFPAGAFGNLDVSAARYGNAFVALGLRAGAPRCVILGDFVEVRVAQMAGWVGHLEGRVLSDFLKTTGIV